MQRAASRSQTSKPLILSWTLQIPQASLLLPVRAFGSAGAVSGLIRCLPRWSIKTEISMSILAALIPSLQTRFQGTVTPASISHSHRLTEHIVRARVGLQILAPGSVLNLLPTNDSSIRKEFSSRTQDYAVDLSVAVTHIGKHWLRTVNVRFWPKADIAGVGSNTCFGRRGDTEYMSTRAPSAVTVQYALDMKIVGADLWDHRRTILERVSQRPKQKQYDRQVHKQLQEREAHDVARAQSKHAQ